MRLGLPSHVCGVRVAHVTAFDCSAPALQVYAHNFPEDHSTTCKPSVQKAGFIDIHHKGDQSLPGTWCHNLLCRIS
jgi:hypothetical protein